MFMVKGFHLTIHGNPVTKTFIRECKYNKTKHEEHNVKLF